MKTWEMMKMATEDKDLRFKRKSSGSEYNPHDIRIKGVGISTPQVVGLDEEWELIDGTVPFEEALKALRKGKDIRCVENETGHCGGCGVNFVACQYGIINGRWRILG